MTFHDVFQEIVRKVQLLELLQRLQLLHSSNPNPKHGLINASSGGAVGQNQGPDTDK